MQNYQKYLKPFLKIEKKNQLLDISPQIRVVSNHTDVSALNIGYSELSRDISDLTLVNTKYYKISERKQHYSRYLTYNFTHYTIGRVLDLICDLKIPF